MRKLIVIMLIAALAACQTVPKKPGFSRAQVEAMTELGFKPSDENFELGLDDRVLFAVDKSELNPEANAVLSRLADTLLKVGIHGAGVVGHTDSTGSDEYNLALSQRRATSVKAGLVTGGMNPAEIRDQGAGETQPVGNNDTEEGRQQNRRVVIVVTPTDAN
jgi:outer membrane protein OmpA-like peptidoglycan-associated protein